MHRLKKLSEEIVQSNPWWRYKHDTFEKHDGSVGDYYYAESNGMVMLVPVLDTDKIVLTLQHRYLEDRQSVEFPGGGIRAGQDVLEAARAELFEETGCIARELISVGSFEPANGFVRDRAHVYIAHIAEQHTPSPDDTEDIELLYRHPEEIEEMIRRNDIWDGETMATWSLVRHYFLGRSS